jgi:amino acid adenylation domain-containing protein
MLLHEPFERTASEQPEKVFIVDRGQPYTYAEIEGWARNVAGHLASVGVERGDRIALFLHNRVEAVVGTYAALKIGAVFMPLSPLTRCEKLAFLIEDAQPAAFITEGSLHDIFRPVLADSRSVRTCLVAGGEGGDEDRVQRFPASGAPSAAPLPAPGTIDQDLAAILYTSGSTGEPKGVMLTHLNMVSAATSVCSYLGLRGDDIILGALPIAFGYGLYQFLMAAWLGATVVLETSFAFPAQVAETMVRERVTVLPGVPTLFAKLIGLESLPRYDLSALRLVTSAAAALPERHIEALRRLLPHARLFSMYGLTECKRVTFLPPEQLDRRPTSVGRGMPNQEVWLVDEEGHRLPNGSTGQLVIRGSHVMRGYWRRPAETALRLRPGRHPGEVVLYSGDIFRTDEEGYLYFVGRADDIIKTGGEKVSPREVENALYDLAGVVEAAAVGVPDPMLGQTVAAYVVLEPGRAYSEKDVIRHCLSKLEPFMVPRHVSFVDALPKTHTGKIQKTGLRTLATTTHEGWRPEHAATGHQA